jgi:hypothetical protein
VLADIKSLLDQARSSRGGLVLVSGEAGIGKTRLATEAVNQAPEFRRVWSWCAADPAGGSFGPWVQVVREFAAADAQAARMVAASPHLSGLSKISHAASSATAMTATDAARWQLFEVVADLVRVAAAADPWLIILDDVHDAQESSLWLLAHLVPTLRSSRAVVLATARVGEHAWHGHVDVHAALLRQATSLRLGPLNEQQIGELIAQVAGSPRSDVRTRRVLARTGGNPLLVTELVRLLAERPLLEMNALCAGVPATVRAITAERIAGFGPACQRLLSAAAVLGTRFGLDVLAAMGEVDFAAVRDDLAEAEAADLLEFSEPGAGRFVHELIRDAVYERLAPAERRGWHECAASVLVAMAQRRRDIAPAEIAHHLLLVGSQAADSAAQFAQAAGDRATELVAYEDAANWYERALWALDLAEGQSVGRATLLLALGEARLGAGDRAGAREAFLRAAALAREDGRPEILARAALGLGSGLAGFEVGLLDQEQLDLLEEARERLPEEQHVLRALVTARRSVAATMIDSDERRLALAHEALQLGRRAHDDQAQAYALAALCDALAGPHHTRTRLAYAGEIVEHATRLRNPALELLGRRLRLVALLETGDRSAAEAEITAFRVRTEAFRHPLYTWYVPLWRAAWALAEGRFADCRALNELAETQGRNAGSHNAFLLGVTQRWCLLAELEDREGIQHLFSSVDLEQGDALWVRISSALIKAQVGDRDAARRQLDAVAPQLASLPRDSEWLPSMSQVAETIGLIGTHPIARWTYDSLRPFADLFAIEGIGAAIRGPVQRYLAFLASALGDPELARQHYAAALEAAQRLGAPQLAERIQRESAALAPSERGADLGENIFRQDGEYWTVHFGGRGVQLRDSKGLHDLAAMLARPGVHVAALDLAGAPGTAHAPSDAGEVLDAVARDAYRRRLVELEDEASEADAARDVGRAEQIASEREALVEQLSAAYGLGGRSRRAGSDAERARTAVTARVRDAIRRIARAHPGLGQHLVRSIHTGTFCVYETEVPTHWHV